jgi:hypothetical protein
MRCKVLLNNSGRVAYTIFVNDVDYSIQFMHPSLLSLGMIKLPLPCAPALWEAQNATEWVRHMEETRRASYVKNLRDSIEFLLRDHCEHSRQRQRETLHMYGSSAFTLQVLIHGLASAVLEHKFRSVDSQCTSSLHVLKQRDFEQGLGCWYRCFQHMSHSRSSTEMARSSLITYHLVAILLQESLSDIQMAAGIAYSWGRAVTPQRAQDAFLPLVSTQPVGQEAYRHALKVISLCLDNDRSITAELRAQSQLSSRSPLSPLYLTYNTFIAVLVLWAYTLGLSRSQSSQQHLQQPRDSIWVVKAGELKFREGAPPRDNNDTALESGDIEDLESILDRGFARSEVDSQKIEDIRTDVRHLMRLVRNCLAESEWELCTLLTPSIRE